VEQRRLGGGVAGPVEGWGSFESMAGEHGFSVRGKMMLEAQSPPVARCTVVVLNRLGLHLRSAEKFVRLAGRFASEVRVYRDGPGANGKSILDLVTLAAGCGTRLDVEARGPDAEAALAALVGLISASFHEDGEAG
jgi:phosphocarrier protein